MVLDQEQTINAFKIYIRLSQEGQAEKEVLQQYLADDVVRGLVDQFAREVDCVTFIAGDELYMIPETRLSPFHVSNEYLKKMYLRSQMVNADLYLMYLSIIVLLGAFYDSYQTIEPTRHFIPIDEWTGLVNEKIAYLKEQPEEDLKAAEVEFSYHWTALIAKWDAMDDIKETAKKQTGNTISRLSFVDMVRRFLLDQQLIAEIGNNEITLAEKTKMIVQRYFFEQEYNRGILEFLYQFDKEKNGGNRHAGYI